MNAIQNNLIYLTNTQQIKILILLKQSIRIIITTIDLKTKITINTQYHNIIKHLTKLAGNQTNINDTRLLKFFQYFITKHTTRGYLFPPTFEALLLEIIQILEYSSISFPTQTTV